MRRGHSVRKGRTGIVAKDEALKAASREIAEALPEDMLPIELRTRPMFGGYMVYATVPDAGPEDFASNPDIERSVAVINDGSLFLKKSPHDDDVAEIAELAPMYPGGADMWRVDPAHLDPGSDRLRELLVELWRAAPKKKPSKPRKPKQAKPSRER